MADDELDLDESEDLPTVADLDGYEGWLDK
jgi:hypothetical protein